MLTSDLEPDLLIRALVLRSRRFVIPLDELFGGLDVACEETEAETFWRDPQAYELGRKLNQSQIEGVTANAMRALESYSWPGNVRELINVIERAVILCEGSQLDLRDLPVEFTVHSASESVQGGTQIEPNAQDWLDQPLEIGRAAVVAGFEEDYLRRLLERNGGQVGETAHQAGVDPRTLYNKMQVFGLRKEDFRKASEQ